MNLPRILRTTAFRLALAYAALFGLSTAVLLAVIYFAVIDFAEEELKDTVEDEAEALETQAETEGVGAVAATLRNWDVTDQDRPASYLLIDAGGHVVAGDLMVDQRTVGWFQFVESDDEDADVMLGLGTRLPGGSFLIVAEESDLQAFAWVMIRAFAWAGTTSLAFAILGGIVTSAAFLRRLEGFNRTAARIIDGRLDERVPQGGSADEFDRLAANLNAMLDRMQALMESMRQVSNDIAHDLRTPLSRLRQSLETARSNARSAADYQEAIDQALTEADEILATFGALLRIAQIEAGSRRAGFAKVDLSVVFETIAETYAAVAEDNGQMLAGTIEPGICVHGDRELLTQMLANLVENAIRHSGAGSAIEVSVAREGSGAVARIADDGPGVPKDMREKVFRRFFRMETSRSSAGSGLGLSLVAAVAELHGINVLLSDGEPGLVVTLRFISTDRGSDRPSWSGTSQAGAAGSLGQAASRP